MENYKYKWELSELPTDEVIDAEVKRIGEMYSKFASDDFDFNVPENYLEFLKFSDEFNIISHKLYLLHYNLCVNQMSNEHNVQVSVLNFLLLKITSTEEYIKVQNKIKNITEYDTLINSELLADYKEYIIYNRDNVKYSFDGEKENLINKVSNCNTTSDIFDQYLTAIDFVIDDTKYNLNQIMNMRKSTDRNERKLAYKAIADTLSRNDVRCVIYNAYRSVIYSNRFNTNERKYKNPISSRNIQEGLSDETIQIMIDTVRKNYHLVSEYFELKKQKLGLDELFDYDILAPISNDNKLDFKDAITIYKDAVTNFLGDDISEMTDYLFENGKVDVYPNKFKSNGAFCSSSKNYGIHVLLNVNDKEDDLFTLAHEMGHAYHAYLSVNNENINNTNFRPTLSVAECASTFNEHIVASAYNSADMLYNKIEDTIGTLFRQIMYTDFELEVHNRFQVEELSSDDIDMIWEKKVKELYPNVSMSVKNRSWMYISHFFHTPFYCYSYTFGVILSLYLYDRCVEDKEFIKTYKEILSMGGKYGTEELLNKYNIEVNAAFFQRGIDRFKKMIDEIKK